MSWHGPPLRTPVRASGCHAAGAAARAGDRGAAQTVRAAALGASPHPGSRVRVAALELAQRAGKLDRQRGRAQQAALVEPREAGRHQPAAKLAIAELSGGAVVDLGDRDAGELDGGDPGRLDALAHQASLRRSVRQSSASSTRKGRITADEHGRLGEHSPDSLTRMVERKTSSGAA
jgi:hypothetical protein